MPLWHSVCDIKRNEENFLVRWKEWRDGEGWEKISCELLTHSEVPTVVILFFLPVIAPLTILYLWTEPGTCPDFLQGRVIIPVFGIITFIIFLINLIYIFLPVLYVGNLILWCPCFVFSRYDFLHWSMFSIISVTWNRKDISSHSLLHANRT